MLCRLSKVMSGNGKYSFDAGGLNSYRTRNRIWFPETRRSERSVVSKIGVPYQNLNATSRGARLICDSSKSDQYRIYSGSRGWRLETGSDTNLADTLHRRVAQGWNMIFNHTNLEYDSSALFRHHAKCTSSTLYRNVNVCFEDSSLALQTLAYISSALGCNYLRFPTAIFILWRTRSLRRLHSVKVS